MHIYICNIIPVPTCIAMLQGPELDRWQWPRRSAEIILLSVAVRDKRFWVGAVADGHPFRPDSLAT